MIHQLVLSTALILLSVVIAGLAYLFMERTLIRRSDWIRRTPHAPRFLLALCVAVTWSLVIVIAGVLIWAVALYLYGIFTTFEAAFYFALVAYTTLGFGDILLPPEWRLLSGMMSVNGLLNIGILTAMLLEVLRWVRVNQTRGKHWTL